MLIAQMNIGYGREQPLTDMGHSVGMGKCVALMLSHFSYPVEFLLVGNRFYTDAISKRVSDQDIYLLVHN